MRGNCFGRLLGGRIAVGFLFLSQKLLFPVGPDNGSNMAFPVMIANHITTAHTIADHAPALL
jgi:hypothetical protein